MDLNNINNYKYLKYKNKYLNFKKKNYMNDIAKYIKNHDVWVPLYNQEGGTNITNINDIKDNSIWNKLGYKTGAPVSDSLIDEFKEHIKKINNIDEFSKENLKPKESCINDKSIKNTKDCNNFKIIETSNSFNIYFRGMTLWEQNELINAFGLPNITSQQIDKYMEEYKYQYIIGYLLKNAANQSLSNTTYIDYILDKLILFLNKEYTISKPINMWNMFDNTKSEQQLYSYLTQCNKQINICGFSLGSTFAIYLHIILVYILKLKNIKTYIYGGFPCIPLKLIDDISKRNNLYFIINFKDVASYYISVFYNFKDIGFPKDIYILCNEEISIINDLDYKNYYNQASNIPRIKNLFKALLQTGYNWTVSNYNNILANALYYIPDYFTKDLKVPNENTPENLKLPNENTPQDLKLPNENTPQDLNNFIKSVNEEFLSSHPPHEYKHLLLNLKSYNNNTPKNIHQ